MDRPAPSSDPPALSTTRGEADSNHPRTPRGPLVRLLLWFAVVAALAVGGASRLFDTLPAPPPSATVVPSVLYDRFGTPIAEIGPSVAHASLGLEEMAPAFVDAVVAALDPDFLDGDGVDASAYASAFGSAVGLDGTDSEADPAAMGLMRRYIETVRQHDAYRHGASATAEARTLLLELRVGRQLSRAEILERYLNIVYLGRGAYGARAAANAWFGVPAADLEISQAAYLASLIDDPIGVDEPSGSPSDPHRAARLARDRVLVAMYERGYLIDTELAAGRAMPVTTGIRQPLSGTPTESADARRAASPGAYGLIRLLANDAGLATVVGTAYAELVERYGPHRVVAGGLSVTTTIDLAAQQTAFAAASEAVALGHSADIVVLDRSGEVRVLVSVAPSGASGTSQSLPWLVARPLGDVLGPTASPLHRLAVGSPRSTGLSDSTVPVDRADAAHIAEVFSVAATGGERRVRRIILSASLTGEDGMTRDDASSSRWPMERAEALDAAGVRSAVALMEPFTLGAGVEAFGRGAVAPGTGDVWFAGWTSHFTAAVRVGLAAPSASVEHAKTALSLFQDVLSTMQYAELSP